MSMQSTALPPLLTTLDAALDATGAPFLELANTGITEMQIAATLEAAGLGPAPIELYEWFQWHNGSREVPGRWGAEMVGPGFWTLFSLEDSLADRARWMETWPPGSEMPWDPSWLPIAGGGQQNRLAILLRTSTTDHAHVGFWAMGNGQDVDAMQTAERSLADVVTTWLRALRERYVWWDETHQAWDMDGTATRPEFRLYS